MKSALNSIGVQIIAAVVLLACAAALTNQCVEQANAKSVHHTFVGSMPDMTH